jgi:hypothetical protein
MGRKRHLKGERPHPGSEESPPRRRVKSPQGISKNVDVQGRCQRDCARSKDESDRGAIILGGSVLEDVLARSDHQENADGEARRAELVRPGGLLSTFQDKISLGLAMAILNQELADQLHIMRQLRNACAHSIREVTMETPEINSVFGLLLDDQTSAKIAEGVPQDVFRFILGIIYAPYP